MALWGVEPLRPSVTATVKRSKLLSYLPSEERISEKIPEWSEEMVQNTAHCGLILVLLSAPDPPKQAER